MRSTSAGERRVVLQAGPPTASRNSHVVGHGRPQEVRQPRGELVVRRPAAGRVCVGAVSFLKRKSGATRTLRSISLTGLFVRVAAIGGAVEQRQELVDLSRFQPDAGRLGGEELFEQAMRATRAAAAARAGQAPCETVGSAPRASPRSAPRPAVRSASNRSAAARCSGLQRPRSGARLATGATFVDQRRGSAVGIVGRCSSWPTSSPSTFTGNVRAASPWRS